jgi:hypothetical protein
MLVVVVPVAEVVADAIAALAPNKAAFWRKT